MSVTPKQRRKYLKGGTQRSRCILCGKYSPNRDETMRMSMKNYDLLALMLSSRVLYEEADLEQAKLNFQACVAVRKRTCHKHFADAAKHLAAELVAMGIPFSSYGESLAPSGTTAYVDQKDIPRQFVERLNEVVKQFDKDRSVTNKDVTKFINDALWRYHSGPGWDSISKLLPGIKKKDPEKAESWSKRAAHNAPSSSGIKREDGLKNGDYGIPDSELSGHSDSSFVKVESKSDSINISPTSSFDLIRPLPRLEETDPTLLQRSVAVDVEALLKLFQFCPQCGQKLVVDGAVQLLMDGAAPLVHYVCDRCSQEEPIVKSWKG